MSWRRILNRGLALIRKRDLETELEAEIRAHLEVAEDEARANGLSLDEARREARLRFGPITEVKEAHRERRTFAGFENFSKDFAYGIASLRRTPGFAAVVIAVLAVGIGGTVAMFSVIDTVLVKPLPFPHGERIVGIWEAPQPGSMNSTTPAQFIRWKSLDRDFDAMSAEQGISAAFNNQNSPVHLDGKLVTPEYFRIFNVNTLFGRTFTSTDERESAPMIVLSNAAWKTYFGSDTNILEQRILLDGQSCRVIGVLQPSAFDRKQVHFWKLLTFSPEQLQTSSHWLRVYGRLKPDVSLASAKQRIQSIYRGLLSEKLMDEDPKGSLVIEPLAALLVSPSLEHSIRIAFGAVLLVLLIACANVANLLFSRGVGRRSELAIRAALGAGRMRLITQMLTECLVICLFGGAAGVCLARMLILIAKPVLVDALPFTADVSISGTTLLFVALVIFAATILTGILPALHATLAGLADSLKKSTRSSSEGNLALRRSIVAGEVALSLVLLSGSLLLMRSLNNLQKQPTGVRIEQVSTAAVHLLAIQYSTGEKAALFYDALHSKLASEPGITSTALSTVLPLNWISNGEGLYLPGADKPINVRFKRVDPGYFETLDIPVLSGRKFRETDRQGAPFVAIANQALIAQLAARGLNNAVGKSLRVSSGDYSGQTPLILSPEIVGMVRNERTTSPGQSEPPVIYLPLAQCPHPSIKLLVRSRLSAANVAATMRRVVHDLDPNLPVTEIATMQQVQDATLTGVSRPALLIAAFACVAVFLALIGLYGVISYSVMQRRKEFGIRLALGAQSHKLLLQVIGTAAATVALGVLLGLAGVYLTTGVLRSLLFEVSPLDPLALAAACVSMMFLALAAAYLPARRAAMVDPTVTLRDIG
jgi:predicted permease